MSDGTKIEWTDATANVINGCTVVSPGCEHCYAMRLAATRLKDHPSREGLARMHNGHPQWTGKVSFHQPALEQVLRWRRPRRIFWNAHGDTFHPDVPDEWIDLCFAAMAATPQHTHQVLTKRPERARTYLRGPWRRERIGEAFVNSIRPSGLDCKLDWEAEDEPASIPKDNWPIPNVWLGTSVEDQRRADERVPILLDTPAAVRWLSMEPLLGPVEDRGCLSKVDWVVVGGESGPDSRPMHPNWARSIRDQCAAAGVPFHFKQWGDWEPFDSDDLLERCAPEQGNRAMPETAVVSADPNSMHGRQQHMWRVGKREAGRLLDGVQHDGYPG